MSTCDSGLTSAMKVGAWMDKSSAGQHYSVFSASLLQLIIDSSFSLSILLTERWWWGGSCHTFTKCPLSPVWGVKSRLRAVLEMVALILLYCRSWDDVPLWRRWSHGWRWIFDTNNELQIMNCSNVRDSKCFGLGLCDQLVRSLAKRNGGFSIIFILNGGWGCLTVM